MKILLPIILFFISQNLFSQNKKIGSTYKVPFDTNKIKEAVRLSNTSEVFSYDSLYIWSDKRSLSEIMNERSGYFVNDFGLGGRNVINFNGYSEKNIGIFRDGIQINDNLFGGFDIQNISVNEINKIEEISNVSSFLYGINSTGKAINVITKDVFQPKPFSQLRYSQDRYNSLFADVFFTLPFSRKINWMAGATKHSLDGRYNNSEFDIWRGRTRLNFYLSPKFNLNLNFYYYKIKRGLNEGLAYVTNEDSLKSSTALVVNSSSNEQLENFYYDATLIGSFFKDENALTKLKLYSINSLREYRNQDAIIYYGISDTIFFPSKNYHYIQYAVDIKQNFNFRFSNRSSLDLIFGGNVYLNYYGDKNFLYRKLYDKEYSFLVKTDFKLKDFFISMFARIENFKNSKSTTNINYGGEGNFKIQLNNYFTLKIFSGANSVTNNYPSITSLIISGFYNSKTKYYYEAGLEFDLSKFFSLKSYYFQNYNVTNSDYTNDGINTRLVFKSKYIDLYVNYDYLNSNIFPANFFKSDIYFHNYFFRNKLNLKTGLNVKYYSSPKKFNDYSQTFYQFFYSPRNQIQKDGFQMDFYIGARIGHANVNITLANIFNNFNYNTFLYPLDDRGGFLNSISRFTIVWDFIN